MKLLAILSALCLAFGLVAGQGVVAEPTAPLFANSLSSASWSDIIGGPLNAVIDAQVQSAMATVDFINSVGLNTNSSDPTDPDKKVIMINFLYKSEENGVSVEKRMQLPFLTMLPIPYVSVRKYSYELLMDVSAAQSSYEVDATLGRSANVAYQTGQSYDQTWGGTRYARRSTGYGSVTASATIGATGNQNYGTTTESYKMEVYVEAENAEIPPGTERVLDLLESLILA
mmetsp:Transcript_68176/g.94784  ORF Transcript_68176/g.94784 Transcript_68176/m.94784 type:complete len:229 (-) Transcript_68176:182-868(-)